MAGLDLLDYSRSEPGRYEAIMPRGGMETVRHAEELQRRPVVSALATMVLERYQEAREAKDYEITPKLIAAARVRNGEHDAEFLRTLADRQISKSYVPLLDNKCVAATAELRNLYFNGASVTWGMETTPMPTMPASGMKEAEAKAEDLLIKFIEERGEPATQGQIADVMDWAKELVRRQIMREAKTRSVDAHRLLDDVFTEGGYFRAIFEAIDDLTTFPSCFVLGPMPVREHVMEHRGGRTRFVQRIVDKWKCLHPQYVYPQPGISEIDEGFVIVRGVAQRQEVEGLIGVPGVDSKTVRSMLALEDRSDMHWDEGYDEVIERHERMGPIATRDTLPGKFDTMLYMGPVEGKLLREYGVDAPSEANVPAMVKVVGQAVVKAVVDKNPRGTKPLLKASYFEVPHSFWGKGIPEKCEDIERNYHACLRSISQNMGLASGPQVMAWIDAFAEGEDIESMYPWKLWLLTGEPGTFRGPQGSGMKPLDFYQPDANAHLLITIAEYYERLVDRHTGVSALESGSMDLKGAGRTSSGAHLADDRANTVMRGVTMNLDQLIQKGAENLWEYMLTHNRVPEEIVGDVRMKGMGLHALNQKMQSAVRALEYLSAVGSSPEFMSILGRQRVEGLLRTAAKMVGLEWEVDDTEAPVPSWAASALGVDMPAPQGAPGPQGPQGPPGGSLPAPGGDAGPAAMQGGQEAGGAENPAPVQNQMGGPQ